MKLVTLSSLEFPTAGVIQQGICCVLFLLIYKRICVVNALLKDTEVLNYLVLSIIGLVSVQFIK